jgi:hypothetical protein
MTRIQFLHKKSVMSENKLQKEVWDPSEVAVESFNTPLASCWRDRSFSLWLETAYNKWGVPWFYSVTPDTSRVSILN